MNRKQSEAITLEIATILGKPISTSKTTSNSIELDLGSVELDKVLGITDESEITNYTYNVIPKNGSSNKFYNLVYTKIGKNKKVKILEYAMTDAFKDAYYKGQKSINQFKGTITEISIGSLTGKSQDLVPCPQIEIILPGTTELSQQAIDRTVIDYTTNGSSSGGSTGSYSAGSSSVSGLGSLTQTCGWVAVSVKCASGEHSVGETCSLDVSLQPSLYFWNNCTGATISSYKTSNTKATKEEIPCNPGATGVIAPSKAQILKDEFLLTGDQWRFIRGNDAIASSLFNYYYGTVYKAEAKAYDLELLAIMMQNPGLVLDATQSEKSPFNVDTSTITDATPEGLKFNTVYNKLLQSPKFKELFTDLFGANSRFNIKFQIGAVTNSANGDTKTDVLNPILNTITINPSLLLNKNKLEIAKTIIHECIHAYLNVKLVDPYIGMSIPTLNSMEFCDVINQKYNGLTSDQNQHNFIYNFMLPTIETILADVKDKLVSPEDNANIISTVIYPNYPTNTPSVLFNWDNCFHNIALGGLQDCTFFKNEIGTFFSNGQVETIIDAVKMNNYNQYKARCQTWLH